MSAALGTDEWWREQWTEIARLMRCIGADGAAEELVDLALVADAPAKPPKLTLIRGGKACDDA